MRIQWQVGDIMVPNNDVATVYVCVDTGIYGVEPRWTAINDLIKGDHIQHDADKYFGYPRRLIGKLDAKLEMNSGNNLTCTDIALIPRVD